jgi:hypothetical protein
MRRVVLLLLLPLLVGCNPFEGHACTLIGSLDGIGVEFGPGLQLVSGSISLVVCDDDGCASFGDDWARRPRYGGLPGLAATWKDLGRSFDPGVVHVEAELRDEAGHLLARREQDVELSRVYPNGKDCDGDGFVNGGLALSVADAVTTAS